MVKSAARRFRLKNIHELSRTQRFSLIFRSYRSTTNGKVLIRHPGSELYKSCTILYILKGTTPKVDSFLFKFKILGCKAKKKCILFSPVHCPPHLLWACAPPTEGYHWTFILYLFFVLFYFVLFLFLFCFYFVLFLFLFCFIFVFVLF